MSSNPDLLNVQEAARLLRISAGAVYALCQKGELPHLRLGLGRGAIRIERADLLDYMAKCKRGPESVEKSINKEEPRTRRKRPPEAESTPEGASTFTNLDGARLRDAWRRQGVLADPPGERSARSSGPSYGPSTPPTS